MRSISPFCSRHLKVLALSSRASLTPDLFGILFKSRISKNNLLTMQDKVDNAPLQIEHVDQSHEFTGVSFSGRNKAARRLVLKQDLTMLPLLAGGLFPLRGKLVRSRFCLIELTYSDIQDRGPIGNARIPGLQRDLHLTDDQFYNSLLAFCEFKRDSYLSTIQIADISIASLGAWRSSFRVAWVCCMLSPDINLVWQRLHLAFWLPV